MRLHIYPMNSGGPVPIPRGAGTTASPVVECRPTRPVRADWVQRTIRTVMATSTTAVTTAERPLLWVDASAAPDEEGPVTDPAVPSRLPAGATADGDGVTIGHGPVRVDTFIDFLCPFCRRFELSCGPALADLVTAGQISLIYHPMNFLDEASTTN